MSKVLYVQNELDFNKVVSENELVLVDFFATWCRPCQMLGPVLDEVSEEVNYKVVKVDVDNAPDLAAKFAVRSIPTLIVFKNGDAVDTELGGKTKLQVLDFVSKHM